MKWMIAMTVMMAVGARADLACRDGYYRPQNASVHLFLVNEGKSPVTVSPPVVDGFHTATLTRDGLHVGSVLWYRCRPNPIPPGGTADVTIVLAEPAEKPVSVEILASDGTKITKQVSCAPQKLAFQAIRFGSDLRTIDLSVRADDPSRTWRVKSVRMDGRKVGSPSCESADGFAFARIRLQEPLVKGSFHVFEVETDAGMRATAQARAIEPEFLIGVYGSPTDDNIKDWAAHGCNHYLSFGSIPADLLDTFATSGISVGAKYIGGPLVDRAAGKVTVFDEAPAIKTVDDVRMKPNLLYHHLVDEPDVSDYYANRTLGASGMELMTRQAFFEKDDPQRFTFIQIDNTFRPRNYRVYGEAADVSATHRYSLGSYIHSEAGTEQYTKLQFLDDLLDTSAKFRSATEPRTFWMIPQFFNLGNGRSGRPPTIEEMRLQCYASVSEGASGLIHYIHSGSGGGGEGGRCKPLWDAMTDMHAELMRVGEVVSEGTPAPMNWVTSSSPNLYARLIVSGDRMAVVLINRAHRTSLESFVASPVRGAEISIHIPAWMKSSLGVVPADGGSSVPAKVVDGRLRFTADEVRDARCFLICPKSR